MSDIVDAFTTAVTGRPAVNAESDLSAIIDELVHAAGSKANAARALGVTSTTFYRWGNYARTGVVVKRGGPIAQKPSVSRRAMIAAARRLALSPGRERELKTQSQSLVITGVMKVSEHTRRQTIHLRNGGELGAARDEWGTNYPMPDDVMAEFVDLWLAGNDAAADEVMREAIHDHYVAGMIVERCDEIDFE